ncbi:MAG: hypothetical protein PVH68_04725 [Armatimonadota bacterium]|jgi:hypothetical protein
MDVSDLTAANGIAFGVDVTYTPDGGDAVALSDVLWTEMSPEYAEGGDGTTRRRMARMQVESDALSSAPARRATVTKDGETWVVLDVRPLADAGYQLTLVRQTPDDRSHGTSRRPR